MLEKRLTVLSLPNHTVLSCQTLGQAKRSFTAQIFAITQRVKCNFATSYFVLCSTPYWHNQLQFQNSRSYICLVAVQRFGGGGQMDAWRGPQKQSHLSRAAVKTVCSNIHLQDIFPASASATMHTDYATAGLTSLLGIYKKVPIFQPYSSSHALPSVIQPSVIHPVHLSVTHNLFQTFHCKCLVCHRSKCICNLPSRSQIS